MAHSRDPKMHIFHKATYSIMCAQHTDLIWWNERCILVPSQPYGLRKLFKFQPIWDFNAFLSSHSLSRWLALSHQNSSHKCAFMYSAYISHLIHLILFVCWEPRQKKKWKTRALSVLLCSKTFDFHLFSVILFRYRTESERARKLQQNKYFALN